MTTGFLLEVSHEADRTVVRVGVIKPDGTVGEYTEHVVHGVATFRLPVTVSTTVEKFRTEYTD